MARDDRAQVPVGSTRDIEFVAAAAGDWAFHCHMTHHVMNQDGPRLPNMMGVPPGAIDPQRAGSCCREYMTMGDAGMGAMADMRMRGPKNSIAMLGAKGPFATIDMGGMFAIIKIRDDLATCDDPGWYEHPAGTGRERRDSGRARADMRKTALARSARWSPEPRRPDPVCGMTVDPATAPHHATTHGRDVSLLRGALRERLADPARFVTRAPTPSPAHDTREYTCPMHPEVCRSADPALCPICGMALEPRVVSRDDRPESRARRHAAAHARERRIHRCRSSCSRCRTCCPASRSSTRVAASRSRWIQLALATPVVVWGAWPFFVRGWAVAPYAAGSTCSR